MRMSFTDGWEFQIKNANYKGKWIHPEIDNPEYHADDDLYKYDDFGAIGIDIWQVRCGHSQQDGYCRQYVEHL